MYLNCHSFFSFKYGTLSPEDLLLQASAFGIPCLALTDINNTSGIADFVRLAPVHGIKPIAGIDFRNGNTQQFVGLAKNNEGFFELNNLLTHHLHEGSPVPARAPEMAHVFVVYPLHNAPRAATLRHYEYVGVRPHEAGRLRFSEWARYPHKLVMLAPVTFRDKAGFNTHRLLRAMDHNTLLSKLDAAEQALPNEVMQPLPVLQHIYEALPGIVRNTQQLMEQCSIDLAFGKNKNKTCFTGSAQGDKEQLVALCREGMQYRYPDAGPEIHARVEKELRMIHEMDFASYFLINHDIVRYAQHKNYFYVGRGSGANSVVAYLLRITDVDPVDLDLYFERFINPSRINPPDFDIDFSWNDRDDIIEYIFNTHGRDHVSMLATYSTFQRNSVVRELGKVFGLPKEEIDSLLDRLQSYGTPDSITRLIDIYSARLHDFPSHLSIHAGGILISEKPIQYYTARSMPPKGFPLAQFSMLEAEDLGLYKFDILSQRGLGKIKDTVEIVKENTGDILDIHDIKRFKHDARVRTNLQQAKLMGCFYVESPAMRMLLTKLRASTYLDLVAASSIIRPGVAQSGMMQEYIRRFHHPEKAQYAHPMMKELMQETYGVMVYQEDVIKVAHYFAGLTLTESDMLRRGMSGKFRGREEFKKVEEKFFTNCRQKNYDDAVTREVWRQIESFAGYAFSKGHSASYAVESYQAMFLKTYYPIEYMVSCINNGGGFYNAEYYVHEARMHGASIEAPHINESDALTRVTGTTVYLGLHLLAGLENNVVRAILKERESSGPFVSLGDFMHRVEIEVEQLRILIRIGAFRFTGHTKKELLWDIHKHLGRKRKTEVHQGLFVHESRDYILPPLDSNPRDDARDEMELLGFTLTSPFSFLKETKLPLLKAADLPMYKNRMVEIVGYYVTYKPTRTIRKERMMFGCFLDSEGVFFDTTHFPQATEKYPFRGRACYLIRGKVAEEFGFFSIEVSEQYKLDSVLFEDG